MKTLNMCFRYTKDSETSRKLLLLLLLFKNVYCTSAAVEADNLLQKPHKFRNRPSLCCPLAKASMVVTLPAILLYCDTIKISKQLYRLDPAPFNISRLRQYRNYARVRDQRLWAHVFIFSVWACGVYNNARGCQTYLRPCNMVLNFKSSTLQAFRHKRQTNQMHLFRSAADVRQATLKDTYTSHLFNLSILVIDTNKLGTVR